MHLSGTMTTAASATALSLCLKATAASADAPGKVSSLWI
jgi:hypothetical protein